MFPSRKAKIKDNCVFFGWMTVFIDFSKESVKWAKTKLLDVIYCRKPFL